MMLLDITYHLQPEPKRKHKHIRHLYYGHLSDYIILTVIDNWPEYRQQNIHVSYTQDE